MVWLTGFGIASRLPRERQPPEPPEVIAGTLAYMAPEQTGRMNRSIVRSSRASLAMGHRSHPRQELHLQRGGSHGREAEAVLGHHPGEALKQLACLGNVAEIATLRLCNPNLGERNSG